MTNAIRSRAISHSGAALVLTGVIAILVMYALFGAQVGLLRFLGVLFAGIAALIVAVRHPAALIAPVLFIPRLTELPGIHIFGNLTALNATCILLASGLFLRWLLMPVHAAQTQTQAAVQAAEGAVEMRSVPKDRGRVQIAFLLFAAVIALSYIYTPAPHYGAGKLTGFLTLGGSLFFLPFLVSRDKHSLRDFTAGTVLFAIAVAASSLSFSATGAMDAADNPVHIGKGQVIGLAIVLLLYWPIQSRWLRILVQFVCIPWLAIGLISAETRGPLFSLLLVIVLSLLFNRLRSPLLSRQQMLTIIAILAGAVILLSMFWFYGQLATRFGSKVNEIVELSQGSGEARGTAVERLVYYRAALDAWLQHPVLGWGIGGWSMAYWNQDTRQYPHNLFLEVLVEQGALGLTVLSYFLLTVFAQLRSKYAVLSGQLTCLLPCAIYLLSIAMFSGDLDDDRFLWFWCGMIPACCALVLRAQEMDAQPEIKAETQGFLRPQTLHPSPSGQ
jgi:O-antigen ligase